MADKALAHPLHVRVAKTDLERIKEDARMLNVSVSEYMRALALLPKRIREGAVADPSGLVVVYDIEMFRRLVLQIRYWGYHYDQCVHAMNTIASKKLMYPEDAADLFGHAIVRLDEIDAARKEIVGAACSIAEADRIQIKPKGRNPILADLKRPVASFDAEFGGTR